MSDARSPTPSDGLMLSSEVVAREIWDGFYRPHRKLICHAACRAGFGEAEAEVVAVEACRTLAAAVMTDGVDYRIRGLKARLHNATLHHIRTIRFTVWQATNSIRRQVKAELKRLRATG